MNRREDVWLAWYMCTVSLVLMVLGLLLVVISRSPAGAPVFAGAPIFDYWLENTVIAVSFSAVGAVIAPRLPPHNAIGWIFCAIGLVAGMRLFVAEYAIVTLLAEPGTPLGRLPGGEALAWVSSWLWAPHIGLFVFLGLLFPDGRPPSPRWRPFAWLVGAVIVVGTVAVALWPETAGGMDLTNNPLGIEAAAGVVGPVEAVLYVLALVATASLVARLRHSKGVERQQVKWFAYAAALLVGSALLYFVISEAADVRWLGRLGLVLVIVGTVSLPVAMGIAIFRYRLYNIDLIINRTLVYGSLTAVLALVYIGSVVLLQNLFRALTGEESQLGVVASTLVIAALFNPLRRRTQDFIDRRFYRRKYDAAKTLEAFSNKLRVEPDVDALADDVLSVVRETMQPAHVSLWLRPDTDRRRGGQTDQARG